MDTAKDFYERTRSILNGFVDRMGETGCINDDVLSVGYFDPETKKRIGLWIWDPVSNREFIIEGNHCYCINHKTRTIVES